MTAPTAFRGLLKAFGWTLAGSLVGRGGAFLGTLLAGRELGSADFGRLSAVTTTVGLFGAVGGFGLGLTATAWLARLRESDPDRAGRIAGSLSAAGWSLGLIGAALLAMTSWLVAGIAFDAPELGGPLLLAAALIPLQTAFGVSCGQLVGCDRFQDLARASALNGITVLPAMWGGSALGGISGAVVGMVLAQALGTVVAHRLARGAMARVGVRPQGRFWWHEWRVVLGYSLPAALASAMVIPVNWESARWLAREAGFHELGLFHAGNQWRMMLLMIPLQLASASLPRLAKAHASGDRRAYLRSLLLVCTLAMAVSAVGAGVVSLAPGLFLGLQGSDFADGGPCLQVLAWCALPMALNNLIGSALHGAGQPWRNLAATSMYAVLSLAALLLIPAGAVELAWSQMAASVLAFLMFLLLVLTMPTHTVPTR